MEIHGFQILCIILTPQVGQMYIRRWITVDYPFILVFWQVMTLWGSEHILILNSSVAVLWKAILEVGDVLQYYDPAKRFPAWGFGARPIDGPCSHCFNLNGSTYQPEVLQFFFCYIQMLVFFTIISSIASRKPTLTVDWQLYLFRKSEAHFSNTK